MPNSKKETESESEEINILKTDDKNHIKLTSHYPDDEDDRSSLTEDTEDGFTGFINMIDARKVRVKSRIFPEDLN